MRYRFIPPVFIGLLLAGCIAGPSSPPTETAVLRIAFTPAIAHFSPEFSRCANKLGDVAIIAQEMPAEELSLENIDVALRWGPPQLPGSTAFVVSEYRLVVVTHRENPINSLTMEEIASIYTADAVLSEKRGISSDFQPYAYPPGSDLDLAFQLFLSIQQIRNPLVKVVPDPAAMLQAISKDIHGLGVIPSGALTDNVQEITIPEMPESRDSIQVLAMTSTSPSPHQMMWIKCLQSTPGNKTK